MVSKTSDLILGSDLKDSELVATIALIEFFSNFSLLIAFNNVARQIIKKNTELKNKTLFEKGFELFVNRNNNNTKNHNEIINIRAHPSRIPWGSDVSILQEILAAEPCHCLEDFFLL